MFYAASSRSRLPPGGARRAARRPGKNHTRRQGKRRHRIEARPRSREPMIGDRPIAAKPYICTSAYTVFSFLSLSLLTQTRTLAP